MAAGKTQPDVSALMGVAFQQFQKYERGANRIPVDRLVSLAGYLEVPLSTFVDPDADDEEFRTLAGKFKGRQLHTLIECWPESRNRKVRAAMIDLVRCVAGGEK